MDDWYRLPGFNQPMSSMSHLVGAVIYTVLAVFMVCSAWRCRARFWFCGVFAGSAVTLLSLSGVLHMFEPGFTTAKVMLRLDVAAIFLLIAGSFTPIHGVLFRGAKRWGILVPLWSFAIAAITLRTIFFESMPYLWGMAIFLAMGWLGLLSTWFIYREYGRTPTKPLVLGGLLYTVGAAVDAFKWPVIIPKVWGPHDTFHLCVLAALGAHWYLVSMIAGGSLGPQHRVSLIPAQCN